MRVVTQDGLLFEENAADIVIVRTMDEPFSHETNIHNQNSANRRAIVANGFA